MGGVHPGTCYGNQGPETGKTTTVTRETNENIHYQRLPNQIAGRAGRAQKAKKYTFKGHRGGI
jgi:hypothetical protein